MTSTLELRLSKLIGGGKIYFFPSELPPGLVIPNEWRDFGPKSPNRQSIPSAWGAFAGELPWISEWLERSVHGTAIVVTDRVYLGYLYTCRGRPYMYLGGVPICKDARTVIDQLPSRLQHFYQTVHDGFTFCVDLSMGPARSQDISILENFCDDDGLEPRRLLSVFSNGAGDHLTIDLSAAPLRPCIWWHEDPCHPEDVEDMWDLIDTWMSIFLEDSEIV
ncbi:hypothetical protein DBR33_02775 [Stenotrophomonas sp. HMWF022]|uniref:hypothetical protein n=1 Tax=Stenotrophomonas sp. HMWF023 TaxID=2056859 RepID=UPI000D370E46|nr:hypothetical protein [Stenotrophomonas sp. HMWF023]PTS77740.1 hypothetical protein DBR20_07410 [Stenotrophomonas sp. HMWF023]PTT56139.1 hypothetical protein DBR33_02775 [Stenotrophomonas sp. HMWF022]